MTTITASPSVTLRWPTQLLTAARFTGHFVVALATVLLIGADHAEY